MKLLNKITLWFIGIVFLVTPLTMYISYNNIKNRVDNAEVKRMQDVNDLVAEQLRTGETPERYTQGRPIMITSFAGPMPEKTLEVVEDADYHEDLKRYECQLTVNSYYEIGGMVYKISSYDYITKSDHILKGMLSALVWKMLLIILAFAITAALLSRYIFSPFRQTMKAIHHFNLRQKEKIRLPYTNTREFRELNNFLVKMTDKAIEDYASVKEFSENASHELQTPLAVMRSKVELLSETAIDATQAELIGDMQNAIEKLTRINRSLLLLTKMENQEYEASGEIRFCRIAKEALGAYSERIAMKNLTITSHIDKNVALEIHPALAEILVTNLLSNAVRHNIEGGSIRMELTSTELRIENTGHEPDTPTEELFHRFKKSNQCDDSTGLGLAIVKQICEVTGFSVSYTYFNGWHQLCVSFRSNQQTTKPAEMVTSRQHETVIA